MWSESNKDPYLIIKSLTCCVPAVPVSIHLSKISVKDLITEYVPTSTYRAVVYSTLPSVEGLGIIVLFLEPRVLSTIKT